MVSPPTTVVGPTNPSQYSNVVAPPVTNAVATIMKMVVSVPGAVAALAASPTPIVDVIALVQEMLTTAIDAVVPLVQLPSDLASLLLGFSSVATAAPTVGQRSQRRRTAPPALQMRASQPLQMLPPGSFVGAVALPDEIASVATLGDLALTGLHHELPASGTASPAENVE